MDYQEDLLKKITSIGTLGYSLEKLMNVLDVSDADRPSFSKDFDDPKSPVFKAYQKGVDQADYMIDTKLFNQAKDGDLKALEKYEKRKEQQQISNNNRTENQAFLNPVPKHEQ